MSHKKQSKRARIEVRKLADLVAYPSQEEYFGKPTVDNTRELVNQIRRKKLKDPIEVLPANKAGLPPNTIVKGHRRKFALEQLGRTETRVLVRYDLADADAMTIEREFFADDVARRQLDTLGQAAVWLRLYELEKRKPRGKPSDANDADARDRLGKAVGKSGRSLSRIFRVAKAPIEVRNAYRAGKLSMKLAGRVGELEPKDIRRLVACIRKGGDARAMLEALLRDKRGERIRLYPPNPNRAALDALDRFVECLDRACEDIQDDHLNWLGDFDIGDHLGTLVRVLKVLVDLFGRARIEDPNNPDHQAQGPTAEQLREFKELVAKAQAEAGLAEDAPQQAKPTTTDDGPGSGDTSERQEPA
jgi:ParB-like chromosome segregation protein Spo0J